MSSLVKTPCGNIFFLCNPDSGSMAGKVRLVRETALAVPGAVYREARNTDEFQAVLEELCGSRPDLLVIIGGDGTIHAVLSILFNRSSPSPLPLLALIPAGTTNMTAKNFHVWGDPLKVLRRLVEKLKLPGPVPCITRPLLRVQADTEMARYGLIFGAGIIVDGVNYFRERIRGRGWTGEKASLPVMLGFLLSLLLGKDRHAGINTVFSVRYGDGEPVYDDYLSVLATSLDRLLLGSRPYWGEEPYPIHVTCIRTRPAKLWRSILPLLSGRGRSLSRIDGYHSANRESLTVIMTGNYVIDGEIYATGKEKAALQISASDSISVMDLSK